MSKFDYKKKWAIFEVSYCTTKRTPSLIPLNNIKYPSEEAAIDEINKLENGMTTPVYTVLPIYVKCFY